MEDIKMQLKIYLELGIDRQDANRVTAILNNVHNGVWRHHLGYNGYHNFLLDLFEDLSAFSRSGDVAFFKHGQGDLCASWQVAKDVTKHNLLDYLIEGVDRVNYLRRRSYLEKYRLYNNMSVMNNTGNQQGAFMLANEVSFVYLNSDREAVHPIYTASSAKV